MGLCSSKIENDADRAKDTETKGKFSSAPSGSAPEKRNHSPSPTEKNESSGPSPINKIGIGNGTGTGAGVGSDTQAKANAAVNGNHSKRHSVSIRIGSVEIEVSEDRTIARQLKSVPLLSKLNDSEREILATALTEKEFKPNEIIIKEGEEGVHFFIIKEGTCIVSRMNSETGLNTQLAELKPGDYFGETALLNNSRRGATVTALTNCLVLSLSQSQFISLFGSDRLNITFAKRAAVSAESARDSNENELNSKKIIGGPPPGATLTKTPEIETMLLSALKSNILFQNLDQTQHSAIVAAMWKENIPPDTKLIQQGTLGNHFYVVDQGTFHIFVSKPQNHNTNGSVSMDIKSSTNSHPQSSLVQLGPPVKVAERTKTQSFGELALLYNAPRAATVQSIGAASVWVIDRWTFRSLLSSSNAERLREYENFLKQVRSFEVLLEYERAKLAESLEPVAFSKGQIIFRQGEDGDTFFIIKQGKVSVKVKNGEHEEQVAEYGPGDYFGERALILNERRAATVVALSDVDLLYLHRTAFRMLLGPLDEIFSARESEYERTRATVGGGIPPVSNMNNIGSNSLAPPPGEKARAKRVSSTVSPIGKNSQSLASSPSAISNTTSLVSYLDKSLLLSNMVEIGILGKGSFGTVKLVRDKSTMKTYALKQVSKQAVVQLGQQEHILSEKKVMASMQHPFLVRLYNTFQDRDSLYFLLEVSLGGELFTVLRARTFFDEPTARFYAAAVVLGFEYMHSKGIVYRDLKPENLLLDSEGYLKITDFGFAKVIGETRTFTLCGTPDYLAPEVVSGAGHSYGVDWWTLGILIYEMLASYPPFYDEDPMKTYARIMGGNIAFPMHFSKAATDLIKKLLHPKPTKRLGVLAGGAVLVKEHIWFSGFDWDLFLNKKIKAPIVLPVKSPEDLTNFEEYPDDDPPIQPYTPDPKHSNWDASF